MKSSCVPALPIARFLQRRSEFDARGCNFAESKNAGNGVNVDAAELEALEAVHANSGDNADKYWDVDVPANAAGGLTNGSR